MVYWGLCLSVQAGPEKDQWYWHRAWPDQSHRVGKEISIEWEHRKFHLLEIRKQDGLRRTTMNKQGRAHCQVDGIDPLSLIISHVPSLEQLTCPGSSRGWRPGASGMWMCLSLWRLVKNLGAYLRHYLRLCNKKRLPAEYSRREINTLASASGLANNTIIPGWSLGP